MRGRRSLAHISPDDGLAENQTEGGEVKEFSRAVEGGTRKRGAAREETEEGLGLGLGLGQGLGLGAQSFPPKQPPLPNEFT